MNRNLLIPAITIITLISCSKRIEDRLVGEWRIDVAYKKELFGRDYFQTGYENGKFTFFESGTATFVSSQDTLSGYWKSDFWSRYNSSNDETERMKYLEIYLANFNRNKVINWKFDNFSFRNNWKCIRAVEFFLGRDRYYEFVRP
jgi:hypothetical protein